MIFIVIVTYLLLMALRTWKCSTEKGFYFSAFIIIAFVGFRGYDVGSLDTLDYVNLAMNIGDSKYGTENVEAGFSTFVQILEPFMIRGYVFLTVCAILAFTPLFIMIKRFSDNVHVSLLCIFLVVSVYIMYFVCLRQTLGMAVQLSAILFFLQGKKYSRFVFVLLTIVAFSVHNTSVIIALFFLLFNYVNIKRKVFVSLLIVSYAFCIFNVLDNFSIIGSLFIDNLTGDDSGGAFSRIEYYLNTDFDADSSTSKLNHLVVTFICIAHALILDDKKYNSLFTKMYLVGSVIYNMFYSFPEIYRMAGLFNIFGLVSVTFLINPLRKETSGGILKSRYLGTLRICIVLLFVYSYYSFTASTLNQLHNVKARTNATLIPYQFFWEDKYNY